MLKPRSQSMNEQRIKDLRMQNSRNYSHVDGRCVYNYCLCRQCKCQVMQQQHYDYHKPLLSNYKREYKWKYSSPPKPIQQVEYQSNFEQISRISIYQRNFKSPSNQKNLEFQIIFIRLEK